MWLCKMHSDLAHLCHHGQLMQVDKKAADGRIRFVVLEALGRATLRGDLAAQLVRESIAAAVQ